MNCTGVVDLKILKTNYTKLDVNGRTKSGRWNDVSRV
jgi:hypothetical protein